MTIKKSFYRASEWSTNDPSDQDAWIQTLGYFILTVLGFSFWFFMVVPFASHRETYGWLGGVPNQSFAQQFSFGQSSTYRPLAQVVTWLGFRLLNPNIFPTSVAHQFLLQGFVYGMFVLAWWLIYAAAPQRRLFALVAFVVGGAFFSGYVHLFHIYGMFYVPVILTLGALLLFLASEKFETREAWFAVVATSLAFWHPFATALFIGFYFGFYVDTFRQRSRAQHFRAVVILLVGMLTIAILVVFFPRNHQPLDTRALGFLVSYQTNEVNRVASLVAFLLAQMVVFSMELSTRLKLAAFLMFSALSILFLWISLPLLFLWFCLVFVKLIRMRRWSLFFLMLTAALLPFGGGIGTPIYALFAIITAVYVTPLGWNQAEKALSVVKPRYILATIVASTIILLVVRVGVKVPIVTKVATPLLAEREKTYQLENILAWLHKSDYCGDEIDFAQKAGSPVEDVKSAISRQYRPPAGIHDVQFFWNTSLRCHNSERLNDKDQTAIVTFGGPPLASSSAVFKIDGKYADEATVWVRDSQK